MIAKILGTFAYYCEQSVEIAEKRVQTLKKAGECFEFGTELKRCYIVDM